MLGRRHERGDTIIEVMFAFVLFSMVIVGAFMIMNQGMALAQRSLEVTQVRQRRALVHNHKSPYNHHTKEHEGKHHLNDCITPLVAMP